MIPITFFSKLRGLSLKNKNKSLQCDSVFAHKSDLKIYMRTQTGEKPHHCSHCNKGFTQKSYLKFHMRTHTRVEPYQCSQCDSVFAHKSDLKIHMRTHTGERPHHCSHCNKRFCTEKCSHIFLGSLRNCIVSEIRGYV